MIKKLIGIILLIIGVFVGLVLLTYGGPVFPHILGPVVAVTTGAILLLMKRKGSVNQ
jgi:hypothetical protein